MDPHNVVLRPIISEAAMRELEQNTNVFEVSIAANKIEVKRAVEQIFGVKVKKVNILRVPGKVKRRGRYVGKTRERKKAYVTLTAESKKINVLED
ncbi:MAG: hypothetical protein RLZ12_694 [Bacillota bacterium]|jgi:large subunit ribosomal protein L23